MLSIASRTPPPPGACHTQSDANCCSDETLWLIGERWHSLHRDMRKPGTDVCVPPRRGSAHANPLRDCVCACVCVCVPGARLRLLQVQSEQGVRSALALLWRACILTRLGVSRFQMHTMPLNSTRYITVTSGCRT